MKKIMAIILLTISYLQSPAQARIGIVAGGVLAKTTQEFNNKSQVGGYLGILMEFKLAKSVSLKPQCKYIKKGEATVSGEKGSYNYLELPINFLYIIPTRVGRFSVGCGPFLDYMISGTWTTRNGGKEKINFSYDNVNQLDFGANAVVGFDVRENVFFNINYTLGLQNVWSADNIGTNKNRALGFGIGVMF